VLSLGLLAPAMLGLLALAAVVVWLHTARPRRQLVPSMQIWLTLPNPAGAARPRWQWPRLTLPLVLQLAALAAMVLALAQPFMGPPPPAHLVMVLDGSAPMNAPSGAQTYFEEARAALLRDLEQRRLAPPHRVSVILAGPQPRLLAARHPYEPHGLTQVLNDVGAADGPANWHEVANLVAQTLAPGEPTAGLLVGSADPQILVRETLPSFTRLPVGPALLAPALDLRLTQIDERQWGLNGVVRGDPTLVDPMLEIQFTPQADIGTRPPLTWDSVDLALDTGEARVAEVLEFNQPGLVTITSGASNGQGWPGAQALFLTTPQPARQVLYLAPATAPDQPLLRAIVAHDNLEIFRADTLPADHGGYDLVIVDGLNLDQAPDGATLWIGASGIGPEQADSSFVGDADFWHPFHPLTRTPDWTTPSFGMVSTRALPPDSDVLLSGAGQPLLATQWRQTWHDVHLAFDPRQVDWGSGDALPLLANALTDWLGLTGVLLHNCQVSLPCGAQIGTLQALAAGEARQLTTAVFTPTRSGLYRDAADRLIAVNAMPDRAASPQGDADQAGSEAPAAPISLAHYLLIAAALLLVVDLALRWRLSGKRALPGLVAPLLLLAALAGLAVPSLFMRSVPVQLVPDGHAAPDDGLAIAAGPKPRIAPLASPAPDAERARTEPAPVITHASAALALAAAAVPAHQVAAITPQVPILETGPALGAQQLALPAHVHLDPAPAPANAPAGPTLLALALPANAMPGDRLALTALVHSAWQVEADIEFQANGTQLVLTRQTLEPGMNRIETELPALAQGETRFSVLVSAAGAPPSALSVLTAAKPGRPIALLSSDPTHAQAFARLASAAGEPGGDAGFEVLDPAFAPDYLRDWLKYDAVVLLNMPARSVTSREAGLIESAVTHHGLGLVMLGGPNAFGPGGYFATPFEALSPLSARVPREAPEVTMVFVLDRSGSMNQEVGGGTRLEMARQATQEAVSLLNPESWVGIVVFDSEARTVLPLTRASDAQAVQAALATVDTGGGTSIGPGLMAGWDLLAASDAQARHMIVMTDGLSQPDDFEGIAGRMRAQGITVSAVAVGTGADAKAVTEIAAAGGGSVHASDDFAALPSILSQEAMLLSSPVSEGAGQPRALDVSHPLLRQLPPTLPAIDGVVLTTAKPEADVALTTSTADGSEAPLLATWRQGNGTVMAFASDVTGSWTRAWQTEPALAAFWPHVIRQIRPVRPPTGAWLTLSDGGEDVILMLEVLDLEGAPRTGLGPMAEIAVGDGTPFALPLIERRAGIYWAAFVPDRLGRIRATIALPPEPAWPGRPAGTEPVLVEAARERSRPFWETPVASAQLAITGGAEEVPQGWGVRLVQGQWLPWLVLALIAFLGALILYMRPRLGHRRQA